MNEIAALPGLDGLFVGPGDLNLRLKLNDVGVTLESAYERVAAASKQHGKAWGCPVGTPEILKKRQQQGGQLLNHGGDVGAIMEMLKNSIAAFNSSERGTP